MTTEAAKTRVIHNEGIIDRMARVLIGVALMGFAVFAFEEPEYKLVAWGSVAFLLSIYPILTGILGWDPSYQMIRGRTCSESGRNQCGTLPYQVKAMTGHAPKFCEVNHSLEDCHD